jgi:hypothetical protein
MREPPLRKTWEYSNITQPLSSYERGMPGRSYQTKPGLPSGCQVNIKCFYAKSTCLGSNYRNIKSDPGNTWYRRSFEGICRGLWIIIAELACGYLVWFDKIFQAYLFHSLREVG